ncbi:N-acetylmuramoyl-L-alanine amidase [Bacteroidota bacterium]
MEAKNVRFIVIHCTAGFGNIKSIKAFWKSKGWRTGGYHRVIKQNGKTHTLYPFGRVTNGVKNHNHECIHISYIGGVDPKDYKKAMDTRTNAQKDSLTKNITEALQWIDLNGGDSTKVEILGHRDFSPDQNGNGKIESWERIKECPSFEVKNEYKWLNTK